MKKYSLLLLVLALITVIEPAVAQSRTRYKRNIPIWYRSRFYTTVGGGLGSANYFGDITPTTSFISTELKFTRTSLSGFVTHKFTPRVTGKATLAWHRLKGDDNVSADPNKFSDYGRYLRNLHFRNDIIELTGVAMFDLFENNSPFFKRPLWTPYAFIGLGVIYSNPQAREASSEANGQWISLRPLQTEGKSYSPVHVVIPAGLGVRYKVSQRIDIGFELGYRYAFTDYLDDVSGRYIAPSEPSEWPIGYWKDSQPIRAKIGNKHCATLPKTLGGAQTQILQAMTHLAPMASGNQVRGQSEGPGKEMTGTLLLICTLAIF
jgi:hypothetical protein